MTAIKIIELVLLVGLIIFFIRAIYNFVYSIFTHRKRMNRLNRWSEFNRKMLDWAGEIQDPSVKVEYLEFCTDTVFFIAKIKHSAKTMEEIVEEDDSFMDVRTEIIKKYINHIPSLKQEIREEKLNKIFK